MTARITTIIFILLAAAAVYFAGNGRVQLWDRDEPRYAQCSRQMLQSGDWVVPRLYDILRAKKPPLIYWCQATAMKILGRDDDAGSYAFAARVPSVLAMLGTLIVLSIVLWRSSGSQQATWTVFIFATSGLAIIAAKICLTDSTLILFIVVAQCCLYAIWRGSRSWGVMILMAIMFGLGFMIKGPFIFGIVACTAGMLGAFRLWDKFSERRKTARATVGFPIRAANEPSTIEHHSALTHGDVPTAPAVESESLFSSTQHSVNWPRTISQIVVAALIFAALVAPWFWLVHHRAPEFLPAMFLEGREHAVGGKEGHTFPPGYHFLMVWPMFMPWSLFLPMGIGMGLRHRKNPQIRFALSAVLGPWLMVEFMGTKLPHYFLPAYPALAFLVAFALRSCMRGESNDLQSRGFRVGAAFWAIAIAIVGAAPWLAAVQLRLPVIGKFGTHFEPLPLVAMGRISATAVLLGATTFFLLYIRRLASAFVTMGLGMLAVISILFVFYLPHADFLRLSIHAANVLKEHGAVHPGDAKMIDYKEPSLAFYQGGTIREGETPDLVRPSPAGQPRWGVITRSAWDTFPARYKAVTSDNALRPMTAGPHWRIIDSQRGWAYADRGRVVELLVIQKVD